MNPILYINDIGTQLDFVISKYIIHIYYFLKCDFFPRTLFSGRQRAAKRVTLHTREIINTIYCPCFEVISEDLSSLLLEWSKNGTAKPNLENCFKSRLWHVDRYFQLAFTQNYVLSRRVNIVRHKTDGPWFNPHSNQESKTTYFFWE